MQAWLNMIPESFHDRGNIFPRNNGIRRCHTPAPETLIGFQCQENIITMGDAFSMCHGVAFPEGKSIYPASGGGYIHKRE